MFFIRSLTHCGASGSRRPEGAQPAPPPRLRGRRPPGPALRRLGAALGAALDADALHGGAAVGGAGRGEGEGVVSLGCFGWRVFLCFG